MFWKIDYPHPGKPLYANVTALSGWCVHESEPVRSISLHVDGRWEADAILGYPRVDAAGQHPEAEARLLRSGFRCEFDYAGLAPGERLFELRAQTDTASATLRLPVCKLQDEAPVQVTDLFVDIVGACNLRCAMCPHGGHEGLAGARDAGVMPPDLFERVLLRLREQCVLGEYVNLYNWGEPLLHPQLSDILAICESFGVKAVLSTNLSVPPRRLEAVLARPVELLMVSLSGVTQQTYARNHTGGDIARVLKNLHTLAARPHRICTILLKYLVFEYNRHELPMARRLAKDLGLAFGAYAGVIPSVESFARRGADTGYARLCDGHVGAGAGRGPAARSCPQQTKIIIDHRGRLERCSMTWHEPSTSSVLAADIPAYLVRKLDNSACAGCLASGYSHYRHFEAYSADLLRHSTAARASREKGEAFLAAMEADVIEMTRRALER